MTREEIAVYRQKLRNILKKEGNEGKRIKALEDLAKEVGAGYVHTEIAPTATIRQNGKGSETITDRNPISISESELVLNIHQALQTEIMIDVCNTTARNFWITMVAAIAAVISALAAWAAVVKMVQ